jgi:hypothetical protein
MKKWIGYRNIFKDYEKEMNQFNKNDDDPQQDFQVLISNKKRRSCNICTKTIWKCFWKWSEVDEEAEKGLKNKQTR